MATLTLGGSHTCVFIVMSLCSLSCVHSHFINMYAHCVRLVCLCMCLCPCMYLYLCVCVCVCVCCGGGGVGVWVCVGGCVCVCVCVCVWCCCGVACVCVCVEGDVGYNATATAGSENLTVKHSRTEKQIAERLGDGTVKVSVCVSF